MGADSSKFEEIAGMPVWVRAKPSFPYESDLLIRRSISQITRRLAGCNISLFTEFYDVFYTKCVSVNYCVFVLMVRKQEAFRAVMRADPTVRSMVLSDLLVQRIVAIVAILKYFKMSAFLIFSPGCPSRSP